jgi:hypothetical protein
MLIATELREVVPSSPALAVKGVIANTVTASMRFAIMSLLKPTSLPKALLLGPSRFPPFKSCSSVEQTKPHEHT